MKNVKFAAEMTAEEGAIHLVSVQRRFWQTELIPAEKTGVGVLRRVSTLPSFQTGTEIHRRGSLGA